jgi:hypothetical protein
MPENLVRAVLEAYVVAGVLGLARRDGNLRHYDLLDRLLPAELLAYEVPAREQLRHKLLSRYRAHGLLSAGGASARSPASPCPPSARRCARSWSSSARSCPSMSRAARQALRPRRGAPAAGGAPRAGADRRVPPTVRLAAVGHRPPREPVRLRLRLGGLLPTGEAPLGLLRAPHLLPRSPRRPDQRYGLCRSSRRHQCAKHVLVRPEAPCPTA